MEFRRYDAERDQEAVHRIWREVGWVEEGKEEPLDLIVGAGQAMVAELSGSAECVVLTAPGRMRYLDEDLSLSGVTGVTTSRVARKRSLAKRLLALALAMDASEGAVVAGLGAFEQGFYDQLGFGTGSYDLWVGFDPAALKVDVRPRVPRRISRDDWAMVHASRLARLRSHGGCNFSPAALTRAEMIWADKGFGLGYCDGEGGALTHHFWCDAKKERGPYEVLWMAFQTREQFLKLMALLKSLGDQVRLVRMSEPPGIQLQDLIAQPFKQGQISEKSSYAAGIRTLAWWQVRMCDLPGCLARTHLGGPYICFNLSLSDPVEAFLDDDAPWRGIGGDYVVTLGPSSWAEPGIDRTLPTLMTTVNAFTRLWLGVRPATGLAVTDTLAAPQELLDQLDRTLRLPQPVPDWPL